MVSATSAITNMGRLTRAAEKMKSAKALTIGGTLLTAGFCLFDFMEVPSAFKLKYDYDGKKVDGLNISAGAKETAWSSVKCASAFALPWIIGMFVTPLGPVAATVATLLKLGSPILSYTLLDKLRPHEKEVIQEICQAKGIDITKPDNAVPSLNKTDTSYG